MFSPKPLIFILYLTLFRFQNSETASSFIYASCSPSKFDPNSLYQSSLNSLYTSIAFSSSRSSYDSYSSNNNGVPIFGLYQCRNDLSFPDCTACVQSAVGQLSLVCAQSYSSSLQLDGCFIRYSNKNFLGKLDTAVAYKKCTSSTTDEGEFLRKRDDVLGDLQNGASFRVSSSGTVQGHAQCLGDLNAGDCAVCLSQAVGQLKNACGSALAADVFLTKCYARYWASGHYLRSSKDKQVWLSAALTNLRTCKKGFSDLKASNNIATAIYKRYNILDLISNCLAINRRVNSNVSSPSTTGFTALSAGWNSNLLQVHEVPKANFIVSKNGSSDYNSIQAAVNVAASMRLNGYEKRIVIYVKAGVYRETVTISSSLNDLTLIGDGMGKTIVTGSRSVARGYTTFSSPTFSVFGDRFLARGMTFRNTYGPGSQAVALLSGSDQSVFYRCSIEGYQDTLCVYTQRQFYRNCKIYGTIDFIFGNAAAVIQNCNILVRKPIHGESNVITAQGRTDPNQNTGIVIQSCRIRATSELWAAKQTVKSFLGRPWMKYSRTVYLQNVMDDIIHPLGWMPFDGEFGLSTLYYVEYNNTGGGSRTRLRVRWRGYRIIDRASLVRRFTVAGFIGGAAWLPATRVPFSLTL